MAINFPEIVSETKAFFKRHWPSADWGNEPAWREPWQFRGTMFGGEKQGVYALMNADDAALYIGVGASLVAGLYEGHGLNSRTARYCKLAPGQRSVAVHERAYEPTQEWAERGVCAIRTIGFEPEQAYLAYALEAYLLSRLAPPFNKVRSARTKNR